VLADTLARRGLFCDLLAHAPLSLERAVCPDAVREFKLTALQAADEIAGCLVAAAPALTPGAARDLVATANALAGSLWQTANPPPALARLYAEDPRLGHAVVDFGPRLERLLTATAEGLAVSRQVYRDRVQKPSFDAG
jgi:Tetracyclin repressor-like, C-terminal domain